MALVEGCKHSIEVTVPVDIIEKETAKAVAGLQKRVRVPGFRPGKAPANLIERQFESQIRQQVADAVIPQFFQLHVKQENLKPVTRPNVTDLHFEPHQAMQFTVEFEALPEIELNEYRGLDAPYDEPQVADEDVDAQIESIRQKKATFVNVDPRPIEDGDFAVVSLKSLSGVDEPLEMDEVTIEIGGKETLEGFSTNLRGMSPGEEKDFEVQYPEEQSPEKLAGRTVLFHCVIKGIRRKELPEVNDELAQEVGDYRNLEELRTAIRKYQLSVKQDQARAFAKDQLITRLADIHDFPVPETYLEQQIRNDLADNLAQATGKNLDLDKLPIDWDKVREASRPRAIRNVKSFMITQKIAEREGLHPTQDEMEREIARLARERQEPLPVARPKMEKDGTIERLAHRIEVEKTLQFLFDQSNKLPPAEYQAKYPTTVNDSSKEAQVQD